MSSYPEIPPLSKESKKLIVLIHGLGSDGNDLIELVPFWIKDLPDCHFIAPHGVEQYDGSLYGRQWFSRNCSSIDIVNRNALCLKEIIYKKQLELNLTNNETIIVGFSQGSMIGLYLNLIQEIPFHSVILFSGKLIIPSNCLNTKTPVCVIHGELDDILELSCADEIVSYLKNRNIKFKILKIPNLGHSIDSRGLEFALNFIHSYR